jgi:hypothetical protein
MLAGACWYLAPSAKRSSTESLDRRPRRVNDARTLSDVVARRLLDAVGEGSLAAGAVSDLARRICDQATVAGVNADDLLELAAPGSRR